MEDAPSLAKHANNRNISLWLRDAFPHPYSIQAARNFLERSTTDQPRKNFCIEINRAAVGGIGVLLEKIFIGIPRNLVTGSARNFGGAVS
jgi:ribosomal-protein-alanine N-acetyltransferase